MEISRRLIYARGAQSCPPVRVGGGSLTKPPLVERKEKRRSNTQRPDDCGERNRSRSPPLCVYHPEQSTKGFKGAVAKEPLGSGGG